MSIRACFTIFNEDVKKWHKLRVYVLARYGRLRGKVGKGVLDLALKGLEYEKKQKIPIRHPTPSKKKIKRLLELYNEIPDGVFSEKIIHKKLYQRGRFSHPTIKDHVNLLEGTGMIVYHHTEPGPNPRSSIRFFEKGKKEDLKNWVKGWMKEAENENSK